MPVEDLWLRWGYERFNAGVVTHPRSLPALLDGSAALRTQEGDPYHIERSVLERLASACSPDERENLRLPVTVHFSADVEDSAYVIDGVAAAVLHRTEAWGQAYPFRDGKMWLPVSLAVDLMLRYGGALQRLIL